MSKLSLRFFLIAPVYLIIGMLWGMYMGVSDDHTMMPAHAHLNLLGFVVNSVMGGFYALAAGKISTRLASASFWLWNAGIIVLIPLLTLILAGNVAIAPATLIGEIALIAGMGCFFANVLKAWKTGV
jgi:hypothetical protein